MSGSEDYLRGLVNSQDQGDAWSGDWAAAVRSTIRDMSPAAASKHLANLTGKSVRTAERWIAKATDKINEKTGRLSQASVPKPMEQVGIVQDMKDRDAAKRKRAARKAAAAQMRAARKVAAGDVQVTYDGGRDEGRRSLGDLPITGRLADAVDTAADLVESGDIADAAQALDQGVLDAYGVPEGTLDIDDYLDGFGLE